MNEDVKMFNIGVGMMIGMVVLTVGLQVCYRTQDRARAKVRAEIIQTQQDIAARQANFASYVRPEILRNLVVSIAPKSEIIGFQKSVNINDIPLQVIQAGEQE